MRTTDTYRRQHKEILECVSKLSATARAKDAAGSRSALSMLAGKVKLHLAIEDKMLYPELCGSGRPATVAAAQRFQREMGGLTEKFVAYDRRYPTPHAIAANPDEFARETETVLQALQERIAREESQLYPLADAE